ncbi:PH domain-containing protein [Lactiplantibacillus modestisalitolerans]|uniref:PH domain-containing protein n=1 Tax=Lactiplantibacillus modestisalitolerans TaxID=1457219 RepID=A0ABV5WWD0_9LACO|nr:PH domain-containing protein [Lactiplantibacillus modestisalitolerans]
MEEQLPAAIKRVWLLSALISGVIGIGVTGGLWLAHQWFNWWPWLVWAGLGLTILDVVVELGLIPYRYRFWRYQITTDAVYIKRGVIFQREIAIPISRIQNVTLSAGPLLQLKALKAVAVETAASSYDIEGVTPAVADRLRHQIIALAKEARDAQ